jgi:hypothetical protein
MGKFPDDLMMSMFENKRPGHVFFESIDDSRLVVRALVILLIFFFFFAQAQP